jgi:hypothetical protein
VYDLRRTQSWNFHDEIEKNHSGKRIVGWYHTHPRMGIFLSHYDTWLHHNFFPEPWQVALVVEPHKSLAGFFIRRDDDALDPTRYFGFYELNGNMGRSMVEWQNLQVLEIVKGQIMNRRMRTYFYAYWRDRRIDRLADERFPGLVFHYESLSK